MNLKNVIDHFKDAKEVECMFDKKIYNITDSFIEEDREGKFSANLGENKSYCRLYKYGEFAKIISYKEPTCSLTKEQLRSLTKEQLRSLTDPQVKEWFPEVFETVFKVGKWYKNNILGGSLFFVNEFSKEGRLSAKGFGFENGNWCEVESDVFYWSCDKGFQKATEAEVFEALRNEAVKRGYKKGVYTEDLFFEKQIDYAIISSDDFDWEKPFCGRQRNMCLRDSDGNVIFVDGKWAEIITAKTKAEAEKELNCKIVD